MQRTEGSLKKKNKDRKRKRYFILKRKLGHASSCETLPLICLPCTKSSLNATLEISYFKARKHLMRTVLIKVEKKSI